MDKAKEFRLLELIVVGGISGIAVSLVKAIQARFFVGQLPIEIEAAILTYVAYTLLGSIGAVFLVDHDVRGQKMLKSAFLMGIIAPSVFLALLSNPTAPQEKIENINDIVPKISGLFIRSAYAQEIRPNYHATPPKNPSWCGFPFCFSLSKSHVEPSFFAALKSAVGVRVTPSTYTYVVGRTDNPQKASAAATNINALLMSLGINHSVKAYVFRPVGKRQIYVTVGRLGTPQEAAHLKELSHKAALQALEARESKESLRASALLLRGKVIDATALFTASSKRPLRKQ